MNLLMLTKFFPYGTGEAFIENEIKVISEYYDNITIIACEVPEKDSNVIRKVPENVTVHKVAANSKKKDIIKGMMKKLSYDGNFKKEKKECKGLTRKAFLTYFEEKSQRIFNEIKEKHYADDVTKEPYMLYSYWFFMTARVGTLIAEKIAKPVKMFTRAHRYDLYADQNKAGYLPYRKLFLDTYDEVFPCSDNGTAYLKKLYPDRSNNVRTALLGTLDHGIGKGSSDGVFRIVSCSRVEPVKRVNKIVEALHMIDHYEIDIEWTHIGDGSLFEDLKQQAEKQLGNIRYIFTGNMKNEDIMKLYQKEPFDLLVNVSSSEGLPVSIMEAISFGIPCVGTDVGGTKEIVIDGVTGKLIPSDFETNELADIIKNFAGNGNMSVKRESCREFWETHFRAVENYKKLYDYINEKDNEK